MDKPNWTQQSVADYYGVSISTIYRWRQRNRIPKPAVGGGRGGVMLWHESDIVRSSSVKFGHGHNPATPARDDRVQT